MKTDCISEKFTCATPRGAKPNCIVADYSGGTMTSNAGLLTIGLAESRVNLFDRVAACFDDLRNPLFTVHEVRNLVGQRILGLIAGLEDLNDHDEFRKDPVAGAVLGCLESRRKDCEPLAGKSTLNRLELSAAGYDSEKARKIVADFEKLDELLITLFVENYAEPPKEIVLDIDATDFTLHGDQEDKFYHGYYREYCYLPLLMFVDRHPVHARLRTASKDPADAIRDEIKGVAERIRAHWPNTRIIVRTDSGFCREEIMAWCEETDNVDYVLGLAKNSVLKTLSADAMAEAMAETEETGKPCRRFCEFQYATKKTWTTERRVIAKAEALPENKPAGTDEEDAPCKENATRKENHRFIVTSLDAQAYPGQALYEDFYCRRGDAENRVKELKCDLFAERSSTSLFNANAIRLYLSVFAHILYNAIRKALDGTALAKASPKTLCLRLVKIGARVKITARRIHVAMAESYPDKRAFAAIWSKLAPD